MSANDTELIEMILVLSCLTTSVACFARLFMHTMKKTALAKKFKARLAAVDPKASEAIYEKWGIKDFQLNAAFSIEQYMIEKGKDADAELVELESQINAPFKHAWLTVSLIPGGFIAAIAVIVVFDAYLKNFNLF
jgi:hypothetical protein